MEKKVNVNVKVDALGLLLALFIKSAVLLWMMPTIAGLLPALAPLCALGYWQWVGLVLIVRWVGKWIGSIVHK